MPTLCREQWKTSARIASLALISILLILALMAHFTTQDIAGVVLAGGSDWGG